MFPSPSAVITGLGVVRPETDAPHGVERAGVSQSYCASAREMIFHGRVLLELGKVASKDGVFANAAPNRVVEITHASTNALVRSDLAKT